MDCPSCSGASSALEPCPTCTPRAGESIAASGAGGYAPPGYSAPGYSTPGYSTPGYSVPPHSAPGYGPGRIPVPMPASEERLWAMGAHLSPLVGLTVIAPLVVYLVQKDRSALVRHHAAEALNFQITLLIGVVVAILLAIVLIGFVLILGLVVWGLLMPILAAVAASSGKPYRYPLTIPFVS